MSTVQLLEATQSKCRHCKHDTVDSSHCRQLSLRLSKHYHLISFQKCHFDCVVWAGWQLSHSVSTSGPEGPYRFQSVVSPATSFNPHATRLPDGRYLLYNMGALTQPTASGYNSTCTGNETRPPISLRRHERQGSGCSINDCFNQDCQPQQGASSSACIDAGCVLDPGFGECYPPEMNTTNFLHVRIADTPEGALGV